MADLPPPAPPFKLHVGEDTLVHQLQSWLALGRGLSPEGLRWLAQAQYMETHRLWETPWLRDPTHPNRLVLAHLWEAMAGWDEGTVPHWSDPAPAGPTSDTRRRPR